MAFEYVETTHDGIHKALSSFKPTDALCEYVWNGFDAGATEIHITTHTNDFGTIDEIAVADNGHGIIYDDLTFTFKRWNDSNKQQNNSNIKRSLPHGKNGVGRFTFCRFASHAIWTSVYQNDNITYKFEIVINGENLNGFKPSNPEPTNETCGTIVKFFMIQALNDEEEIISALQDEFAWFITLNDNKKMKIFFNGMPIDFNHSKDREILVDNSAWELDNTYTIRFVIWKKSLGHEFSRYYFIDSQGNEVFKDTTKLNKKSDEFFHSVYIQSAYFNNFQVDKAEIDTQEALFSTRSDEEYKKLLMYVNAFLEEKRKLFLRDKTERYIQRTKAKETYPTFENNPYGQFRKQQLDTVVSTLYVTEPKLFHGLQKDHEKVFLRMLDTMLNSGDADSLFTILNEVLCEMSDDDRKELADVLTHTSLSHITQAMKLIKDRVATIQCLKELVFDKSFNTYEKHIQEMIERHFWIFGEQYHLLTAAEPDFEAALRALISAQTGDNAKVTIHHEDKQKEMDIFMIRQDDNGKAYENVVVELKRPSVPLGEKELSQVKRYMRVIKSDDRFNSSASKWTFYLVGNKFDSSGYIEDELSDKKGHGEENLVYNSGNIKIYVLRWSEIFEQFSLRYKHLQEKLQFSKELWLQNHDNADEVVVDGTNNSAVMV